MALFTHSYFGKGEAEINPFEQYIESAVLIQTQKHIAKNIKTDEANEAARQGYVFADWINVSKSIALYVKPSKEVLEHQSKVYSGYRTEAFRFNVHKDTVRLELTVRETGGIRFSHKAIAGDVETAEFLQSLKNILEASEYFPLFSEKYSVA